MLVKAGFPGLLTVNGSSSGGASSNTPVVDYDEQGTLFFHMRPRDETTITTDGSDNVTEIRDFNGSARKIVQYAGTNNVKSGTRTEFGRNVLDFDGSTNSVLDMLTSMTGLDTLFANEVTIYAVVKYDSRDSNSYFIGAEASGGADRWWFGSEKMWARNDTGTVDEEPISGDTYPHILTMSRSNVTEEVRGFMDGQEFADSPAAAAGAIGALGTITLGGLNASGSNTPNVYIEDLLIYEGLHDTSTMQTIWNSLSYECNVPLLYQDFDVFLLAGQSNMAGQSQEAITSADQPYNPRISQVGRNGSYDERIIAAVQELDHGGGADGVGLGMKFAQLYAAANPNKNIIIVPAAEGSTGFSSNDWNEGDSNYNDAISRQLAAMSYGSGTKTFKGILWHQGEQDSTMTEAAYATALDDMIAALRTNLNGAASDTPFMMGQLAPNFPGGSGVKAAILDTPNRVSDLCLSLNTGLTDRGDNIHLDATSLNTYGQRYYDCYLDILEGADNVVNSGDNVVSGGNNVVNSS